MKYFIPKEVPIGRNDDTEHLYRCEDKMKEAVKKAATALGQVLGHSERDFWTRTMPMGLWQVLDSFDKGSAEAAAVGFLEARGYTVGPSKAEYAPELVRDE